VAKKAKKGFMDGYRTYDTSAGFGNAQEWSDSFYQRIGYENALQVVGENDPYIILDIPKDSLWGDIVTAYRRMAKKWHPDRNKEENAVEMMKKINAAFEILDERFKKCTK
jgi:DnaJ-class molecular chaperone